MKIINGFLVGIFALFAWLQLNDPDPHLWVGIYGYMAVVSLLAFFRLYSSFMIIAGMVVCTGGILYLLPSVIDWLTNHSEVSLLTGMSAECMYIEESRECFGLMLALACLVFHYFSAKKLV
jgi:predicted membrane channel-forming protein YqfA (hemolysin III family)